MLNQVLGEERKGVLFLKPKQLGDALRDKNPISQRHNPQNSLKCLPSHREPTGTRSVLIFLMAELKGRCEALNRLEGFADFLTVVAAFKNALKKAQHIC